MAVLVMAFALRALIPVGFMPGEGGFLSLQICPDGIPPDILARVLRHGGEHAAGVHFHHHHSGPDHDDSDQHGAWAQGHCPFAGAAATAAIPPHVSVATVAARVSASRPETDTPLHAFDSRHRLAQPRAPPPRLA